MKETLIRRVGRIISGSLNSVMDAIENAAPETVMEEAIREIDSAIDDLRAELGRIVANKHLANTRLMEANKSHETLMEKIELAIGSKREDLAEAAVSRQLDIEAQIPILEAAITDCSDKEKEMESYINALLAKKREMREELQQYRNSRAETVAGQSGSAGAAGGHVSVESKVEKAASAFDRVLEKQVGVQSAAGAHNRKTASQLAELESMAHKNRIQERLAAIKSKMVDK